MDDWIYFKLQHKVHKEVELNGCIDLDTINDDEPDVEYQQNDGYWDRNPSQYCKINGEDFTFEFDQLKAFESMNWDIISEYLVNWGKIIISGKYDELGTDFIFKEEFDICNLYIAYDRDFENPKMYSSGETINSDL